MNAMKKILMGAVIGMLTTAPTWAQVHGRYTEEQEQRMRQQADNWRRNGNEAKADEIDAQLEDEDWADEMERFGREMRIWQEARQREWEAAHGTPYVIDGPTAQPPAQPPADGGATDGGTDAGGSSTNAPAQDGGPQTPPAPPAQPPVQPPAHGNRWGDYWDEEGRGSNDAGGIRNLFHSLRRDNNRVITTQDGSRGMIDDLHEEWGVFITGIENSVDPTTIRGGEAAGDALDGCSIP